MGILNELVSFGDEFRAEVAERHLLIFGRVAAVNVHRLGGRRHEKDRVAADKHAAAHILGTADGKPRTCKKEEKDDATHTDLHGTREELKVPGYGRTEPLLQQWCGFRQIQLFLMHAGRHARLIESGLFLVRHVLHALRDLDVGDTRINSLIGLLRRRPAPSE